MKTWIALFIGLVIAESAFGITGRGYDTNGTVVSVFDTTTNLPLHDISISLGEGQSLQGIAITSDGATAFVAMNPNQVAVIDLNADPETVGTIGVTGQSIDVAIMPNKRFVYVTSPSSGQIFVLDVATLTYLLTIQLDSPGGIDVTVDSTTLLAVSGAGSNLTYIDTSTQLITGNVPIANARDVIVNPNGGLAYVGTLDGFVAVIDLATRTVIQTIPLPGAATTLAITPDGTKLYAVDFAGQNVFAISTISNSVIATIPIAGSFVGPENAAVDPTGTYLYVPLSGTFEIVVIDVATDMIDSLTPTITVTSGSYQAAVSPFPAAPRNFSGTLIKDIFLDHTDLINRLTWTPRIDPSIAGYSITRNGMPIATIPASGPFVYDDWRRNRHEVDTYAIYSFNTEGVTSNVQTVTVTVP
jgi:DNA-binding beta-propeller fold protein YncE